MAKRSASSDLNHDNWDAKEEPEEPGNFVPLKGSELKDRVIKRAKRSLNKDTQNTIGASPFAAFSGFKANSSSFSFIQKNTADSNVAPPVVKNTISPSENGDSILNKKTDSKDSSNSDRTDKALFPRDIAYYQQLSNLNKCFAKWIQHHLEKNPCCDFTPVFPDYKKYIDTLNVTFPIKTPEGTKSSNIKSSGFFTKPADAENDSSDGAASADSNNKDESNYGANFASNTTNTSTFSFGCKSTPTATSSVSPSGPTSSSKEELINEATPNLQFSCGFFKQDTDKPFSFAVAPIKKDTESEKNEDEYVPPKNEFVAVEEADALFSKRCKLFYKKDDTYAEKGRGTLYLKSIDGKTQLLIRADTNLGNILLNIRLSASLPMSKTGKNNVLIVCVPNPPVDSKEAIPILIRVKTSEDADELLEMLNKHKS